MHTSQWNTCYFSDPPTLQQLKNILENRNIVETLRTPSTEDMQLLKAAFTKA